MKINIYYVLSLLWLTTITACNDSSVKVTVTNDSNVTLGPRIVEVIAPSVFAKLGTTGFYVTDNEGKIIPSQLTYDGLIIFSAEVGPGNSIRYEIHPCDTIPFYPATVYGDFYPQRRDDLSYENELVGFRIYGPGTQAAGEKAFGYDIFFKHPQEELIVPILYSMQTDESAWARVDSLRKIDKKLADEYINTFTYHVDHGLGMDCYAVGATLGAGVAAILDNDSIIYPWCYDIAQILDNGPLRFTALLKFPTVYTEGLKNIIEYRNISLDSYSHLNECKVWFEGLDSTINIVTGFPLRDKSEPSINVKERILAYADPTQGDTNGRALLGLITENIPDSALSLDNHILFATHISPKDTLKYKWGFAWDKTDINSMPQWIEYLSKTKLKYKVKID